MTWSKILNLFLHGSFNFQEYLKVIAHLHARSVAAGTDQVMALPCGVVPACAVGWDWAVGVPQGNAGMWPLNTSALTGSGRTES